MNKHYSSAYHAIKSDKNKRNTPALYEQVYEWKRLLNIPTR